MKKLLLALFSAAAFFTLTADDVLIYKADFSKKPNPGTGMWLSKGMVGKSEFTGKTMKLTIEKNITQGKQGYTSGAQGLLLYTKDLERDVKYEVSYNIKANKNVKIWAAVAMAQAPWKAFKGETVDLKANDWEDVDLEFTVPKSYTGKYVRIIFLGLGKSPDGTVYEISDVKLEKEVK